MASRHAGRVGQLWQLPLLLCSLGLFGFAAYVFIDPKRGPSIDQKIEVARTFLKNERPEASINQLNGLLAAEKLDHEHESTIHTLLATSLDALQTLKHQDFKSYHEQIIQQTALAESLGAKITYESERRLGENYEALEQPKPALEHYRRAMSMDPKHALRLQRKVIELQMAQNDAGPAAESLKTYLSSNEISDGERAWALCQQAKLHVDQGEYVQAKQLLETATTLDSDPATHGQVSYYLGYCQYKLNDPGEAERLLRVARQQMRVENPLDADAAYLLGKIAEDNGDIKSAESFYNDVVIDHASLKVATAAIAGRGATRIASKQDDAGLSDLLKATSQVLNHPGRAEYKSLVIDTAAMAASTLSSRGDFEGALAMLDCQQQLDTNPPPEFYGHLSGVYERRSDQLRRETETATPAEKALRQKQAREMLTKAGDAAVAYSNGLVVKDDKAYGDAMWRAIELYERAVNVQSAISALELFVAQRPDDSLAPAALLKLGQSYQAAGMYDKAIGAFQRNQFRYPNSLAASKSAVPLAQAYIAKGPAEYPKAESVLKSVIENNPLLTPEAEEFKQALFELSQLYYRTGRFEEAIGRLEEMTVRYPTDPRLGQLIFLAADSFRKSAELLETKPTLASANKDPRGVAYDIAEAAAERKERLAKAKIRYDRTIEYYDKTPAKTEQDRLFNKLAHFYRADCLYDNGQFEDSIKLYEAAAFRYSDDPASLAAYVQIVNAYCALGRPDDAKAANERAKWLLRRMPAEAFTNGSFSMPREYWENQLKWSGQVGML